MADQLDIISCDDAAAWDAWLAANHALNQGVWLKIAKLNTGVALVTNDEAVDVGLCWGWISGHRKALDDIYFLQRYTPRRPRSNWSAVNVNKVETLTAAGRMRPPGQAEVDAAKADGRWARASGGDELGRSFLPRANAACETRVVIRLGTVVLGADDVDRAVSFWSQVLGYEPVHFSDEPNGFTILVPPSREGTRVAVQRADAPPEEHPRVHLDLVVDNHAEQAAEIVRLVRLGATRVAWDSYPSDPDFVVLADPEGNRFCVVDASHG